MTGSVLHERTRVAVITGAAGGIGAAIALRLADDGLDIAANDLDNQDDALQALVAQIQAKGRRAVIVKADVASEEQVQAMVTKVVDELGSLDVVRRYSHSQSLLRILFMIFHRWLQMLELLRSALS